MTAPFIAEVRAFGFNFSPTGWAYCNGTLMPISQYSALFSLLGTTYGGDGVNTFGLPKLMGTAAMHWGNGPGLSPYVWGQPSGTETVVLQQNQMPKHDHAIQGATGGGGGETGTPDPTTWLGVSGKGYLDTAGVNPNTQMSQKAISFTGGNQPHNNMQPFQTVNFCIALNGVYPSRN